MSDLNKYLRNAASLSGAISRRTNSPAQYSGHLKPYLAADSSEFVNQYAQYASDFFMADVQGLNPDDFYEWITTRIRMADTVNASAATASIVDDFKMVLFENHRIQYCPPGSKLVAQGSTWIFTNPINLSTPSATGLVRRCNATWNYLDFYGNVQKEPICVLRQQQMANDNDEQRLTLIAKGYLDVLCQLNDATRQIDTNTRMILGKTAFGVTGYTDFIQEFTGDDSSVHICRFTIRDIEPNETDDLVNHVAGGKTFKWEVLISGKPQMAVGEEATFSVSSIRNGKEVIATDADHPVSYIWTSSDPDVCTVDASGTVKALSDGVCRITATLEQNPNYFSAFEVNSVSVDTAPLVQFTSEPPQMLNAWDWAILTAAYFDDGVQQADSVTWSVNSVGETACAVTVQEDNSLRIACFSGSVEPLVVTAECKGHSVSASIQLRGI